MTRRLLPLLLAALAAGAGPGGGAEPRGPMVRVLEPPEGRPVAGQVTLRAAPVPGSAPIVRVVFRIDGAMVGSRESPPWETTWDAGIEYAPHVLEVTAVDAKARTATARHDIPPILLRETVTVLDTPMEEIRLSVTVTDRDGDPVRGLEAADFLVTENGRPQTLSDFGREGDRQDRPLSLLLLVDRSASMRPHLKDLDRAVAALLRALRPVDEVAVAALVNGQFRELQPFIPPGGALEEALRDLGRPEGSTPLFDAIDQALKRMRDRPGRRVIATLTDGWDDQLRLNVNFYQNNYLMDLARRAQRTNTQITLIWPGPPSQGRLAIESLVEETGGLIYYTSGDMPALLQRIARQLQDQYYLAYYSDDPTRDGRRRKIDVQVTRAGIRTWTIGGFFALPPQVDLLRAELQDREPTIRADAVRALAHLEDPDASRLLRSALKDADASVREGAARGLGLRREPAAARQLARALDDDAPGVRTAAFEALRQVGSPSCPALVDRLPRGSPAGRVLMARLLGEMADERALPALAEMLRSERVEERAAAADALGAVGLSAGLAPLDRALVDPDPRVRTHAVHAVAAIGGQAAVRLLERYGGREPDPVLRHLAADALARVLAQIRGD